MESLLDLVHIEVVHFRQYPRLSALHSLPPNPRVLLPLLVPYTALLVRIIVPSSRQDHNLLDIG